MSIEGAAVGEVRVRGHYACDNWEVLRDWALAGLGIVKLAQHSGRAIYPLSLTTSRRKELNNWDRTAINLPFGRMYGVIGEPIRVPRDADDVTLEAARLKVEQELNAASARAKLLAAGKGS